MGSTIIQAFQGEIDESDLSCSLFFNSSVGDCRHCSGHCDLFTPSERITQVLYLIHGLITIKSDAAIIKYLCRLCRQQELSIARVDRPFSNPRSGIDDLCSGRLSFFRQREEAR
jgi:hypothetical protein